MKQMYVCLLSDQTIPNILAVHQGKPDKLFFVGTKKMEEKKGSQAILSCLRLNGLDYRDRHQVIEVNQDSFASCEKALKK